MSGSSSGEEDGDAEWKAAIQSVAAFTTSSTTNDPAPAPHHLLIGGGDHHHNNHQLPDYPNSQNLKHYQLKAQKILNDMLEKTLEVVSSTNLFPHEDSANNGVGIQLFKHAPRGIVFDHTVEVELPNKKPRILPGKDIDEKSKKFKQQLQSVAVEGTDILAAARDVAQKSLAKFEAKEAAAKASAKREYERVTELKTIRGERWLSCMAKDRDVGFQGS